MDKSIVIHPKIEIKNWVSYIIDESQIMQHKGNQGEKKKGEHLMIPIYKF